MNDDDNDEIIMSPNIQNNNQQNINKNNLNFDNNNFNNNINHDDEDYYNKEEIPPEENNNNVDVNEEDYAITNEDYLKKLMSYDVHNDVKDILNLNNKINPISDEAITFNNNQINNNKNEDNEEENNELKNLKKLLYSNYLKKN